MHINEIERYEIAAHAFKRMTGMLAPGKEPAMDSFEEPIERREEAWRYWNHTHGRIITKILDAVCHVIPDQEYDGSFSRTSGQLKDPDATFPD